MDLATFNWLLGDAGQALLAAATAGDLGEPARLRELTRLRRMATPERAAAAYEIALLRARAAAKFGRAAELYVTREGLGRDDRRAPRPALPALRAGGRPVLRRRRRHPGAGGCGAGGGGGPRPAAAGDGRGQRARLRPGRAGRLCRGRPGAGAAARLRG